MDMHSMYSECSLESLPWPMRSHQSYLQELQSHIVKIKVETLDDKARLLSSLNWLQKYPWGRRVKRGAPFGLQAGDRLCVGGDIGYDLHSLEDQIVPFEAIFFRPSQQSAIAGVSVMFNVEGLHNYGVNFFSIEFFVDCILHTVDLGIAQRYCGHSIKCLLECNVFNLRHATKGARMEVGALVIRRHLKEHYKRRDRANAYKRRSTRIRAFSLKKLGKISCPAVKCKGGETRALVYFCTEMLHKYKEVCGLQGQFLAASGDALVSYYELCRTEPRNMGIRARLDLMTHAKNHVIAYRRAGGHMVPKHHGFMHLTRGILFSGNPRCTGTYEDEHENGVVAAVALRVHRANFTRSVFERLEVYDHLVNGA